VWKPVLCQTNLGHQVVASLQRSLAQAGHSPGPIDGVIGPQTLAAVESYQRRHGLATGGVTMETLQRLNVRVR
jgi:peptidoglycan hydrolase-like protein with peptidoglycan-binding domain